MKSKKLWLALMLSALAFFVGCSGSGGGDSGGGSNSSGTLSLSLTDAPAEYLAVYVTIEKVEVHMGGDTWTTVTDRGNGKTYNLLELEGGVREELGITELDPGHYTQMRLILGKQPEAGGINILSQPHPHANYVVIGPDPANNTDPIEIHELKVPSGFQTGIKIVQGFDITGGQTTELVIDFDAAKSVVEAGNSGNWLLKPTIKVLNTKECAIVRGEVKEEDGSPVGGALVSAQQNNGDTLEVFSSTFTAEDGTYELLFLNTGGTYNIVAANTGYKARCVEVTTNVDGTVTLAPPITTPTGKTGALDVTVSIDPPSTVPEDTPHVTLSFRQNLNCDETDSTSTVPVEVKSINFADGIAPSYNSIYLTEGNYNVNASTYGFPAKPYDVTIPASDSLAVVFP